MNFVITNIEVLNSNASQNTLVYFNPWGFSKAQIKHEVLSIIEDLNVEDSDLIIFSLKDAFFGRRSEIAFQAILERYPQKKIIRLSSGQLELFLNNSSV
jgi:hypothetical protein